MTSPIFFDASGKRRRWSARATALFIALILIAGVGFATTVVDVPTAPALQFGRERDQPLPFRTHLLRLRHRLGAILPTPAHAADAPPRRIAFYVPWDGESLSSLRQHYNDLDEVVAGLSEIDANGNLSLTTDHELEAVRQANAHRPLVTLMVQNFNGTQWDARGAERLFTNRAAADALAQQIITAAHAHDWRGVMFDFENLPDSDLPGYRAFLDRLHPQFARAGLSVAMTIPAGEPEWNMRAFAAASDRVVLMDYDEHWQGGLPGPIASQEWFTQQLDLARAQVPAAKLVVAVGSYAYDWHDGVADALTLPEAWLAARDSDALPAYDAQSGNSGFAYDEDGHSHTIWMLDAAASIDQFAMLNHGVSGIALWRLGSEDPGVWNVWSAAHTHSTPSINVIPPSRGTDVIGSGEILRLGELPQPGARRVEVGADGMVTSSIYQTLPTPFVIRRAGAVPHQVALTFDDGPDPEWTPDILDVLERTHTPATFFVIGENAIEHPDILRRIVRDGDEIGNHSYTHPNLAEVSPLGVSLELNATQRLIEAYTGRSTRLFRAPYFGDAEPSTEDELYPAMIAQQHGYTIVGLHVDPGDWRTPGVDQIVTQTLAGVAAASPERSANIILLHDGGGNRSQTLAALPRIISGLRAAGYQIVPVSQLAGLSRDAAMPPVKGSQLIEVRADVGIFLVLAAIGYALKWLFFFAIAMGIARALFLTTLALLDRQRSRSGKPGVATGDQLVSVIIPAFNEERVIVDSVRRVLASDYTAIELIVADDGSKDATSALVAQHFGADPRVTLLTLANGGKASALNRALLVARGEIVIALDADTQFPRETIGKLVRWFADPRIGAVAGNARVGNRVNLVTRWQAIEYVTAQNVERRALDALGAITVVPGAVGAWRRVAIDQVGGYPENTLAEDQDLTIAVQRHGWRVAYDVEALALTEAPETLRALGKQRYRWSFGTLQCLWKHRKVISSGRPRGLAWIGMPQAWLFQIIFAAVSPVIDLALLISLISVAIRVHQHGWDQTQSDVGRMALYWLVFVVIDCLAGWIAYRLEPERQRFPALLLVAQRLVYRQLMYSVVLRSISSALRGRVVGWGKLDRTGRIDGAAVGA